MKHKHGVRAVLLCGLVLLTGSAFLSPAHAAAAAPVSAATEERDDAAARKTAKQITGTTVLVPGGDAVGIRLYAKGVLVIGFHDLAGAKNPAQKAGIRKGDVILSVNGAEVRSNEELAEQIEKAGETAELTLLRKGLTLTLRATPVQDDAGRPRLGLMVRDNTAGIGTLTYFDPSDNTFGSLGHGISDADTEELIPLGRGSLEPVSITSIRPGKAGDPGELKGYFHAGSSLGTLTANLEEGLFGTGEGLDLSGREAVPAAQKREICTGPATIRCTLDENGVREYQVQIVKIYPAPTRTKNMLLRVTDPALLEQTGGIVQGMSGSPILQNGKLVGAVTHVLINDPTQGYGIFIENMLSAA